MSWAKLVGASKGASSNDPAPPHPSGSQSPSSARRDSVMGEGTMKGLLKKVSKQAEQGDAKSTPNENAWRSLKRMSVSVERSSDRLTDKRLSDGSVGSSPGFADLAKAALLNDQNEGVPNDRAARKMSSAFKKLGKAHMGLASIFA
ncbi:hypothetical protein DPMN_051281 [Dreissena polymorpha]|uniref:Uncharacterized protein n=1 Tax=Dreissena polymorpha TaxID=45954 RepID=A0A9D4HN58_DREPO|nr:hypothetical protein DPMN_051281 [Dreissena polymorpha]